MPTPLTKINIQKARLAQLQHLAKARGMSTSAALEELIREEWARTQGTKLPPAGFVVRLVTKNDLPVVRVGSDQIGLADLTIMQAQDFARGVTSLLTGKRTSTMVVGTGGASRVDKDLAWANDCSIVDVAKQGRGFVISIVAGQGEHQTKKSQAISGPLLKDLVSAVIDQAMSAPKRSANVPGSPDAGAFG